MFIRIRITDSYRHNAASSQFSGAQFEVDVLSLEAVEGSVVGIDRQRGG